MRSLRIALSFFFVLSTYFPRTCYHRDVRSVSALATESSAAFRDEPALATTSRAKFSETCCAHRRREALSQVDFPETHEAVEYVKDTDAKGNKPGETLRHFRLVSRGANCVGRRPQEGRRAPEGRLDGSQDGQKRLFGGRSSQPVSAQKMR